MSLRDLHLLGSAVLRQRSAEVAEVDDEVRQFIDDLFETMDAAKGVGLAANQVGVTRRVAVIDADGHRFAMVNPVVRSATGLSRAEEGCLSIPELYAEVTRPERIVLEALDRSGQPFTLEADGLVARAVQHEIDHLDGVLFIDHVSPLKRQLLVARYKKDHRGEPIIKTLKAEEAGR
jgi:peptide deformylase